MKKFLGLIFLLQIFATLAAANNAFQAKITLTQQESTIIMAKAEALELVKQKAEGVIQALTHYMNVHNQTDPTTFVNFPPYYFCDMRAQSLFQATVDNLSNIMIDVTPWFKTMRSHVYNAMCNKNETFSRCCCTCCQG